MIRSDSERPKPHPLVLLVNPGLKIVLKFDLVIPLPVSVKSRITYLFTSVILMDNEPTPVMASAAFLQRFSTTHSNKCLLIGAITTLFSGRLMVYFIFLDVRRLMYSMES